MSPTGKIWNPRRMHACDTSTPMFPGNPHMMNPISVSNSSLDLLLIVAATTTLAAGILERDDVYVPLWYASLCGKNFWMLLILDDRMFVVLLIEVIGGEFRTF